jgi:hypothetical protein
MLAVAVLTRTAPSGADEPTAMTGQRDACAGAFEQAQVTQRASQFRAALAYLAVCQQACPSDLSLQCAAWIVEVRAAMPTIRAEAFDAAGRPLRDVRLGTGSEVLAERLDGSLIALDPGEHLLEFRLADGRARQVRVALARAERAKAVVVRFHEVAPPAPSKEEVTDASSAPVGAYVIGSVGGAALIAAGALTLSGHLERSDLEGCKPDCPEERRGSIERQWYSAAALAGGGALALGGALVWLLAAAPSGHEREAGAGLVVEPRGGGAALAWRGWF